MTPTCALPGCSAPSRPSTRGPEAAWPTCSEAHRKRFARLLERLARRDAAWTWSVASENLYAAEIIGTRVPSPDDLRGLVDLLPPARSSARAVGSHPAMLVEEDLRDVLDDLEERRRLADGDPWRARDAFGRDLDPGAIAAQAAVWLGNPLDLDDEEGSDAVGYALVWRAEEDGKTVFPADERDRVLRLDGGPRANSWVDLAAWPTDEDLDLAERLRIPAWPTVGAQTSALERKRADVEAMLKAAEEGRTIPRPSFR